MIETHEYDLCKTNPKYFIENYCYIRTVGGISKIQLTPTQDHILFGFLNKPSHTKNQDYHYLVRQCGKTTILQCIALWSVIFTDQNNALVCTREAHARDVKYNVADMATRLPLWMASSVHTTKDSVSINNKLLKIVSPSATFQERFDTLFLDEMKWYHAGVNRLRTVATFKNSLSLSSQTKDIKVITTHGQQ